MLLDSKLPLTAFFFCWNMKNHILKHIPPRLGVNFSYGDIIDYQCQIEPSYYFIAINNSFPNIITFNDHLKVQELYQLLTQKYQNDPDYIWKYHGYSKSEDKLILHIFLIQVRPDLFLHVDATDNEVKILYGDQVPQAKLDELAVDIKSCFQEEMTKAESKIFLLYESRGLYLQDFEVKKYPMSIEENYNDDFLPVHQLIIDRLNLPNDKGIVLLHGIPGTGKTSYIRYLTSLINKRMIYISPEFAHKIASPDFLPLLIDNPNSVLIVEDAENIVEARENGRNVSVSNLLNIADGLLSDCLNIQILCTFNIHISKIDQALLRKGRLIASYEFKKLTPEKAQRLSDQLGFQVKIQEPMTLTDVYNQKEREFINQNGAKIGFKG